jgi:hypothetical protein
MMISQIITAQIDSPSPTGSNKSVNLQAGSVLSGKVIEIKTNGKVLIEFDQARVLADVQFPIKVGSFIRVRVDHIGKRLQLTQLPQKLESARGSGAVSTSSIEHQRALLNNLVELLDRATNENMRSKGVTAKFLPDSIQNVLNVIRTLLRPISIDGQTEIIASQLKRWVENSGDQFEQRLMRLLNQQTASADRPTVGQASGHLNIREQIRADLKANLLILKDFLEQSGQKEYMPGLLSKDLSEIKTIVGLLIDDMGDRLQSAVKDRDSEHYLFSHLLNLIPKGNRGLLQVRVPKRTQSASENEVRLSLLLQLDQIGYIRSDLWLMKGGLRVTIAAADSRVKQLIENNLQDLESALQMHFGSLALDVKVSENMEADIIDGDSDVTNFFQQRTIDTSA